MNFAEMLSGTDVAPHYLGNCQKIQILAGQSVELSQPEGFWENWGVCEWASVVGIALCIVTMVGISCFGWFQ